MRECLIENQQRRARYVRRKEAAVKIAAWYKELLTTRRHLHLIQSCRRFQNFSTAAIGRIRIRIRRKCARRVLDFMIREVNASQISTAVQRLRRYTVLIQRCWRTRVAARQAQIALLSLQLTRFETRLLSYNRRKATGNNATVFAATARKTIPLHEEMKMTLTQSVGGLRMEGTGIGATQRQRKVKMDDEEDGMTSQQMLFLHTLTVRVPPAIKEQIVCERLAEDVRRFYHKWDSYVADKKVYATQKPIDDTRLKLLTSAGIAAEPQVLEPKRPRLRVLQSAGSLATMLEKGLRMLIDDKPCLRMTQRTTRRSTYGQLT